MDDDHPLAGSGVAGYRVEELIGRGGMGEVYRAIDVRLGRPVALKVLAAGSPRRGLADGCLRESRLAASLDHPNVVPIYEAGEADGRLFIAMRYVAGGDLRALLRREGALAPARAIAIAGQVADALDAAHRRGLVHRDVKPSNVLLDHADGREHCYLADFGLTQSAAERGPADGQFMGTVDYVSPEQIRGDAVDGRADQYALGVPAVRVPHGHRAVSAAARTSRRSSRTSRSRSAAGERPRPALPAADRRRARARDGQGPGASASTAAPSSCAPRAPRSGWTAAPRGRTAARSCRPRSRSPRCGAGGDRRAPRRRRPRRRRRRRARSCGSTRASNRVASSTPVDGHPGELAVTPGGDLDGRLPRRRPVALRAAVGPRRADHLQRRAARPRRARRQGLRRGRRPLPQRHRLPLRRRQRRPGGRHRLARVRHGVRRGRRLGGGMPVRPAAEHRRRPAAQARRGLPPLPAAGARRERARRSSASLPWAPARCGCSATRSTAACGGSTRARAPGRRCSSSDSRRPRWRSRPGACGSPTVSATASCPSTSNAAWPCRRCRSAAVPLGIAAGAGGVWVANTLDGTVSRVDPGTGRVVATIDVEARRAASRSAPVRSG